MRKDPLLELSDIQGDVLIGLRKDSEAFVFFKIVDARAFQSLLRQQIIRRLTSAQEVKDRAFVIRRRNRLGEPPLGSVHGLNLGFSHDGLTQLLGSARPLLEPAFERGAEHRATVEMLHDPPVADWLAGFTSDRIDGVFLVAGASEAIVRTQVRELLRLLGPSIKTVYAETGNTRPGVLRGHEHFGYRDGISQPGIRGLTPRSNPGKLPDEGLPGQDLVWPGEFVFGYPGQDPEDLEKAGLPPSLAAPWLRNGSYMVFRRLEQKVPEFRQFVSAQAARFGISKELLGARMFGRWQDGAPLELAPLRDNPAIARDDKRNNDFDFADDPRQRKCPYAAHIRKVYPRDDAPGGEAEAQRHRILRAGISFGPEVRAGETTTRHSRGLMFVCYQTSIERQFEYLQRHANDPHFVDSKFRPGSSAPVTPGYDPIIGQAPGGGTREMDEPYPNYPAGNRRTTLAIPRQFVVLTAAGYFFMPSISALRTVLTR